MKKIILFLMPIALYSQQVQDTIQLEEIIVGDKRIKQQDIQTLIGIKDSVIKANRPLLTSLLNYQTPIYFKENGYGMVSSVSFRGTTASQTSVLWNGININSNFLGQSDFNTISSNNYDEIQVKSGGGSVVYGSGAIGGSVHLNNQLEFNKGFNSDLNAFYGSYDTKNIALKIKNSTQKLSWFLGGNYLDSDNDYKIPRINYKNLNGEYWNYGLNAGVAYKFNQQNNISFFIQNQEDERHFSLISPNQTPSKYQDNNFRGLLQWENKLNHLNSFLKLAFLKEEFKYFENINSDYFTSGRANTWLIKYEGYYKFNPLMKLSLLGEYDFQKTEGQNTGIEKINQNKGNLAMMWSHQITPNLLYELGVRNEFDSKYKSPFLYSLGVKYNPLYNYSLSVSLNKNFRAPTFNDLYWKGSGNLNLKAEKSEQIELNQKYHWHNNTIGVNVYWNRINDMIRWIPANSGIWRPINTDKVDIKGLELLAHIQHKIGNYNLGFDGSYAYTDSRNLETDKQLIYVPFHKLNGNFSVTYNHIGGYVQGVYVGSVFTQSDNEDFLASYLTINAGIAYNVKNKVKIGFNLYNIANSNYQVMQNRPMPPINYGITFNFKI